LYSSDDDGDGEILDRPRANGRHRHRWQRKMTRDWIQRVQYTARSTRQRFQIFNTQLIESMFDVTAQTSFKCAVACRRQPILYELANENDSWIRSLILYLQRCHRWDSFLLTYSFFLAAFLHNSSDKKWLDIHQHTILSAAAVEAPGFAL